ncbi:hypothetical protein OYT88_06120 [Sporolactobacillus sp. CQH2019]|uniref:hypothetical protein n=1 Tax=Sporolactobacillus sp. CQH2019 TaxID=3023512 RepID=UPI0023681C97|nr:hypothetical protein [Sporolactobacillus sp. CQH2019]MDD9148123.1 hypothetical protein [Sporolactobacillus sp. CQH2019]
MIKKVLNYVGLFIAIFAAQWIWFTYIKPDKTKTLLELILSSVVFIVVFLLLDLVPKKRIK